MVNDRRSTHPSQSVFVVSAGFLSQASANLINKRPVARLVQQKQQENNAKNSCN